MAENDLGNDLDGLMNDLGSGSGEASGDAGGGLELDPELQALANASEAAPAEGSEPSAEGGGEGGGGGFDADLASLGGESSDSGGGSAPAAAAPMAPSPGGANLDFLLDIKLSVTFEVGRAKMLISDLLTLGQGSVIELHRLVGDELDLLVNGKLVAKGEVVVVNEKFGCKINNIVSPEDRVRYMGGF